MKNLRLFGTESQYNIEAPSLEYPTISYITDSDTVKWMKKPGPHDYSEDYLTFEALESGTFTLTIPANVDSTCMTLVQYSTDNGETWTTTQVDSTAQTITTPTINQGNKVLWKGTGNAMAKNTSNYSVFSSTNNFNISGNIMSLLYGDNFSSQTTFPVNSILNFMSLFRGNTRIHDCENLSLSPTTLVTRCYSFMFTGCTSLASAPELPATTLAASCYTGMFAGCTSLASAPELPATTLVSGCYSTMFKGCTSLTTLPELNATTLAASCYANMFKNCTSLTTVPSDMLPATTLANYCYMSMFEGCTSLITLPELNATKLGEWCYSSMFLGCTSLTTVPSDLLPATTMSGDCYAWMFNDCTSLTTAPTLSATTLAIACYCGMFMGCTSLTTAPELPATTLVEYCYGDMFNGCTNLNYIKAMFTTTPSTTYTENWVQNVAATGTFVKNSSATWNVTGFNGVPTGWTVETASE